MPGIPVGTIPDGPRRADCRSPFRVLAPAGTFPCPHPAGVNQLVHVYGPRILDPRIGKKFGLTEFNWLSFLIAQSS
jgi:hypothetical protein